ncbi:UNVERIFIED_CONTAM: hypothetical protein NCL1_13536 [Trichonephila clavipes]
MDPCYFRCCSPRLHLFHWILLAWKSQSRHRLAFEIYSLLHRIPSRFIHLFIAFLKSWDRLDKVGSNDESEIINAAPVPTSYEIRNVIKSRLSYLHAHSNVKAQCPNGNVLRFHNTYPGSIPGIGKNDNFLMLISNSIQLHSGIEFVYIHLYHNCPKP